MEQRAHHLITRGTAIESVAPLTKVLTETEFYAFAEQAPAVQRGKICASVKRLEQAQRRMGELDRLFIRIYEDNVAGRINDERFSMMS